MGKKGWRVKRHRAPDFSTRPFSLSLLLQQLGEVSRRFCRLRSPSAPPCRGALQRGPPRASASTRQSCGDRRLGLFLSNFLKRLQSHSSVNRKQRVETSRQTRSHRSSDGEISPRFSWNNSYLIYFQPGVITTRSGQTSENRRQEMQLNVKSSISVTSCFLLKTNKKKTFIHDFQVILK